MSPASYYCWLHERRLGWPYRLQPRPPANENFPLLAVILGPLLFAATALLGVTALSLLFGSGPQRLAPLATFVAVGVITFTCGLVHRAFAAVVWNQRASKQRAAGLNQPTPRPAWWVRWLLGPVYLVVIGFLTPLALLTGIENVRGAMAWRKVRTELQARGERLYLRDVAPHTVPAEQNLASLPIFADLFAYGRQTNIINGRALVTRHQWADTNALNRFHIFHLPDRELPKPPLKDDNERAQPPQLADWAVAFRSSISNRTEQEKTGTRGRRGSDLLPTYPAAPSGANDAKVVLTALSVADAEMALICEASRRPYARFPIHWEEGFSTLLPHLSSFKSITRYLSVRTEARLATGDIAGAFADAQCSLRLADALKEEPWLISLLVRIAQHEIANRTIWHGIAAHRWTAPQLEEFEQQLGQLNFLADTASALEGERSGSISTLDGWVTGQRPSANEIDGLQESGGASGDQGNAATSAGSPMLPRGWIRQNQAELARFIQIGIDQARQFATNVPPQGYHAALKDFYSASDADLHRLGAQATIYNIFVKLLAPALDRTIVKGIRGTQVARMAATACVLERYRLKHGEYPATLDSLVPEFVSTVPRDLMDNQPLRYARTDDGLFRLWSVGADGNDNGGVARRKGASEEAERKGRVSDPKAYREELGLDWVWPR